MGGAQIQQKCTRGPWDLPEPAPKSPQSMRAQNARGMRLRDAAVIDVNKFCCNSVFRVEKYGGVMN